MIGTSIGRYKNSFYMKVRTITNPKAKTLLKMRINKAYIYIGEHSTQISPWNHRS